MGAESPGAAPVLAKRSIIDGPTIATAAIAFGLLGARRVPEPLMILAAGVVGIVVFQR